MTDLVSAMAYAIGKFVSMLFSLEIDPGISVGSFFLAVAILGAVIGLVFSLVKVPGARWVSRWGSRDND